MESAIFLSTVLNGLLILISKVLSFGHLSYSKCFLVEVGARTEGAHDCQQIPRLIGQTGQDSRVDHVGRAGVPLAYKEDDLDISAIFYPGQCHIQLSVRENRDSKVNPNAFDRLAPSFVDSD